MFYSTLKYIIIRYKSSLSDVIARLQGLLFSVAVVLLSLPCTS